MRTRMDSFGKTFIAVWIGILVANLVFWGVAIWAVIELVQWLTTK